MRALANEEVACDNVALRRSILCGEIMNATLWSFAERLVPRLASAVVSLTFAAIVGPTVYGYFSATLLVLLGIQAVTDSAVRQIAVSAVRTPDGQRFVRLYRSFAPILIVLGSVGAMSVFVATFMPAEIAVGLLPIPLAAAISTLSVATLARAQVAGQWKRIALAQSIGTSISCAIALPVAFSSVPILAPSVQVFLAESLFALGLAIIVRRLPPTVGSPSTGSEHYLRSYRHAAYYSTLSWVQSQADRLLIGIISGPTVLGTYSLALALSRNVSDALSIGVVNVLRPQVLDPHSAPSDADVSALLASSLRRATLLLTAMTLAVCAFAFVGPWVLGQDWARSLRLAPVLSVSAIPALVAWTLTPVLVRVGRLHTGSAARIVGLLIGVGAAFASLISLEVTAWLIVGREAIVAFIPALALARTIGWRLYRGPIIGTLAGAALALLTQLLLV